MIRRNMIAVILVMLLASSGHAERWQTMKFDGNISQKLAELGHYCLMHDISVEDVLWANNLASGDIKAGDFVYLPENQADMLAIWQHQGAWKPTALVPVTSAAAAKRLLKEDTAVSVPAPAPAKAAPSLPAPELPKSTPSLPATPAKTPELPKAAPTPSVKTPEPPKTTPTLPTTSTKTPELPKSAPTLPATPAKTPELPKATPSLPTTPAKTPELPKTAPDLPTSQKSETDLDAILKSALAQAEAKSSVHTPTPAQATPKPSPSPAKVISSMAKPDKILASKPKKPAPEIPGLMDPIIILSPNGDPSSGPMRLVISGDKVEVVRLPQNALPKRPSLADLDHTFGTNPSYLPYYNTTPRPNVNSTLYIQNMKALNGKMLWPVDGTVSSGFGVRGKRRHEGIDIPMPVNTPIRAAQNGIVSRTGNNSTMGFRGYGNFVLLDHGGGLKTFYAHCSKVAVIEGQRVMQGQIIGYVGSTGRSTANHLHFEVRVNDSKVNPIPYLSGNSRLASHK